MGQQCLLELVDLEIVNGLKLAKEFESIQNNEN
jgi:hypothetical protein